VASDAGSGVKEVRFYYQYCPGGSCGALTLIGSDSTPPYSVVWEHLSCTTYPDGTYRIVGRAEDNCGNVSLDSVVTVVLGHGCFRSRAGRTSAAIVSELAVPGGRGQVVADGTQAFFPGVGTVPLSLAVEPGPHRIEATLVDGTGRPGTWRFDLSSLGGTPDALRVVAGQVIQIGPDAVVFRLKGQPGERLVFSFVTSRTP
jgi:hypothetical protein